MNKDRLKLWIEALRSGEYEQGRHQLRLDDKFCCLGVLCEVAIKDGVKVKLLQTPDLDGAKDAAYDGHTSFPPPSVTSWLEVDNPNILVTQMAAGVVYQQRVVTLNDSEGQSFGQIADALENTYLNAGAVK